MSEQTHQEEYRKEKSMYVVQLNELNLLRFGHEDDPATHVNGGFPFSAATGNKSTALVLVEVEPGDRLPAHTDSAEELLLILEGMAEVSVGDELGRVSAEDVVLLPAMVPHSVRNVGYETVRFVSFFSRGRSSRSSSPNFCPAQSWKRRCRSPRGRLPTSSGRDGRRGSTSPSPPKP